MISEDLKALIRRNFLHVPTEEQEYVMDLWWDDIRQVWKDNRRLNVFQEYEVYGYGSDIIGGIIKKQLYHDNLCERNDVIAFKKVPKIYR